MSGKLLPVGAHRSTVDNLGKDPDRSKQDRKDRQLNRRLRPHVCVGGAELIQGL